ncbi:MAG: 16S rRNA (guanine(527)-N(7))-methyltransferase RsmG [Xanthomonadales bacterium]|nr:16S rRNA (guanine(527)-N(7))-methyltransferase RsmG [Xanthomonadales bacterium]
MNPELRRHAEVLRAGLDSLGIRTSEAQRDRLLAYLGELTEWNRAYNLTAVRDPGEMVVRHLLDSAAILPWLDPGELLDVGSGAGLPGIPLAILQPERSLVLLDANGKKARFMRHAVRQLGLDNVQVIESRLETCTAGPFPGIVARAFAEPVELLAAVRPFCKPGGAVYAMIGRKPETVPEATGFDYERCARLDVPGLEADRNLLIYHRWPESSQ